MCVLSTDSFSIPPVLAADPAGQVHQSSSTRQSWRSPKWWRWLDRPLQRIVLREIADDPHLLRDLGITREQALREAAKPFWR